MSPITEHPLRGVINDELHARPHLRAPTPSQVFHYAHTIGDQAPAVQDHLAELLRLAGRALPAVPSRYELLRIGPWTVKWERHSEFVSVSVLVPGASEPRWAPLPRDLGAWVERLPGQRLVAVQVRVEAEPPAAEGDTLAADFPIGEVTGSTVNGGDALVWTDFRVNADSCTRFLIRDLGHQTPSRSGRLIQRLLEVETYRTMALLGLPLAQEVGAQLTGLERRLSEIVAKNAEEDGKGLKDEHALLDRLTLLAAEAEALIERSRYRFGATAAYADLVERRLRELREGRIPGLQRLGVFLERRFRPAVLTCAAVTRRQTELVEGITRASGMLRTRVDVQLAEQNASLLRSMESRTRAQLRIQEAVEGLSVFAISYYLLGLLKYVLEGIVAGVEAAGGRHVDKALPTAIAVPIVLGAVWITVRRVRGQVHHEADSEAAQADGAG